MFFPTLGLIATTDVIMVDIHQTLQDALHVMHVHNHRSIVVVNQSIHHIITTKDIIRFKIEGVDFTTPLSQISLRVLPLIDKESNVINALNLTHELDEHICVCNSDGTLYGIVTNSDIVGSVDPQLILDTLQIATIFDKKYGFKSFAPGTLMADILDYMKDSPSDCVIIQEHNIPVGILTSKDILHFIGRGVDHTLIASDVMSTPIKTLPSSASISDALDFLRTHNYKRIVVTDENNSVVGVVSQQDLISRTYLKWSQMIHEHFDQFEELTQILQKKNQHLTTLATKDPLTGVNNRHIFMEQFGKECATAKRYKTALSLVMIDLDHFKEVNDRFGHNIGDNVLKTFTSIVLELIREADIFARWGGEEFVVLLRHTDCTDALNVAEKIRLAVEGYRFDEVLTVTCSIGVTDVLDEDNLESAVERADQALYAAKHQGRNRTIACTGCIKR